MEGDGKPTDCHFIGSLCGSVIAYAITPAQYVRMYDIKSAAVRSNAVALLLAFIVEMFLWASKSDLLGTYRFPLASVVLVMVFIAGHLWASPRRETLWLLGVGLTIWFLFTLYFQVGLRHLHPGILSHDQAITTDVTLEYLKMVVIGSPAVLSETAVLWIVLRLEGRKRV